MELENGASFSLETLLEDPDFRAWVLKGDEQATAYWENYIAEYPERAEVIGQARRLLLEMKAGFETNDLADREVESRLQAQLNRLGRPRKLGKSRRRSLNNYRLMVAASLLLLLVGAWVWWNAKQDNYLHSTNYGEWKTVELPDGSVVQLNANTTLRLDREWEEQTSRRVWLSGEAYFQVKKAPGGQQPFQVITEDLTVEVLGTVFNVHNRGANTAVFLEEGRVSLALVADTLREMFLEPGQKLAYSKLEAAVLENGPALADLNTAWKDGLLKFDKTPMREVLKKIEEIYGITFQVEDEKQYERPITSQGVPIDELDYTINVLGRALGLEIYQENNMYIIK